MDDSRYPLPPFSLEGSFRQKKVGSKADREMKQRNELLADQSHGLCLTRENMIGARHAIVHDLNRLAKPQRFDSIENERFQINRGA